MLPMMAVGQTYDFDMTKPQPVYSDENGFGYDIVPAPTKQKPNEPFFFSVRVDDGNYRVRVVLGAKKKAGETTVRAEGRRDPSRGADYSRCGYFRRDVLEPSVQKTYEL